MQPGTYLDLVRQRQPLVHHLTNWVTIGDCAIVTRMFGALPVMAHAAEESGDMAGIASALVLNIGTLTPALVESMIVAGRAANEKGIPVVLDAVGVGATKLRDDAAATILRDVRIAILKGNASEIARLGGEDVMTRGVETTDVAADLREIAGAVASRYSLTVAITGVEDVVAGVAGVQVVRNGHPLMGAVVGTGCMAASVIGAFAAVADEGYTASTVAALACYGAAAEIAAEGAHGPASFKTALFDTIYSLTSEQVERLANIG